MENYYKTQLKKLSDTNLKIKIISDNGDTNFMDLNNESAKEIIEFLTQKLNGYHY